MSKETIKSLITTTPVEYRDPTKLKLAPANKHIVRLVPGSPRYKVLVGSIESEGIRDALLIDKDGYVYDGWTRREIAVDLQFDEVPVKVCVTPENAHQIVLDYTIARKNPTLGQMAYCIAPTLDAAFEEAKARRANNALKTKPKNLDSFSTVEELAAAHGLNYEYLRQARKLHQIWKEHPKAAKWGDSKRAVTLRELYEPRILDLDKPLSIGDAGKAIGFLIAVDQNPDKATGGKPKGNVQKQLELFTEAVQEGIQKYDYYAKWNAKVKEKHWEDVRVIVDSLPIEKIEGMREYHKQMLEEYDRRLKDAKKGGK